MPLLRRSWPGFSTCRCAELVFLTRSRRIRTMNPELPRRLKSLAQKTRPRTISIVAFYLVLPLLVVWVGYLNRGSKEVVLGCVAVITAIISLRGEPAKGKKTLAGCALMGGLATMWFSLKPDHIHTTFSKSYFYESDTKRFLFGLPGTFFNRLQEMDSLVYTPSIDLMAANKWRTPSTDSPTAEAQHKDRATFLCDDIFYRQVVETLFTIYHESWEPEVVRTQNIFSLGMSWKLRPSDPHATKVSWKFFQSAIPSNSFLTVRSPKFGVLVLPPHTVVVPTPESFRIENDFVKIRVSMGNSSCRPIEPPLAIVFGVSDGSRYTAETHEIELNAEFSAWRSGHPDMPRYRKWVQQMFQELQVNFDTSTHWELAMQEFVIYRLSPEGFFKANSVVRPVEIGKRNEQPGN
jgi:hypothetical protein